MKKNCKGFTITEMVIVIAVIAILAAVLIPTFSSIVKKANDSADLQAARNIMVGYVAANNASVDDEYYVKVENDADRDDDDVYFKVNKGQLIPTPVALNNIPADKLIVEKGPNDTYPTVTATTTAPAQNGGN